MAKPIAVICYLSRRRTLKPSVRKNKNSARKIIAARAEIIKLKLVKNT
jgi:hypothetical protein